MGCSGHVVFVLVIPRSCIYRGDSYECGLSFSCVLGGNKALDLCQGGMFWSCCIPKEKFENLKNEEESKVEDPSKYNKVDEGIVK